LLLLLSAIASYRYYHQITLWGPFGEINDYAKKEYGGLVRGYYKERWALLLQQATTTIAAGGIWDQAAYCEVMFAQVERPWSNATTPSFPSTPEHELLDIIDGLYAKYALP
jgi:alpha-N-acetylglucosaminidase